MELNELALRAKSGDEEAFSELMERFKGYIKKSSKNIYLCGYSSEDLLQLGYYSLVKAVRGYDGSRDFLPYALKAISGNYNYEIRKAARHNAYISLQSSTEDGICLEDKLSSAMDLESEYLLKECQEELYNALNALNHEEKELIAWLYFHKKSLTSYALYKNMSYRTLYKRKIKLLEKLKNLLKNS